jgi:hypothetical protein
MSETENKYVKRITDADKQKIINSSVTALSNRPASSATELKMRFVAPIVNKSGDPCLADEVDRVANEADGAISKLYKAVETIPLIVSTAVQFKYTFFQMLKMFAGLWDESVDGAFDSKELVLKHGVFNRTASVGDEFWIDFETVDGYKVKILARVIGFRVGGIDWSFAGSIDAIDLNAYAENNGEGVWNDKLIIIRNGKTQQDISDAIAKLQEKQSQFSIYEFLDALPVGAPADKNKLYLVPSSKQEEDNILEEWLWVDGAWEMVGTMKESTVENLKNGTGKGAVQQVADGVADGFDFTNKNATATAKDPSLTGMLPYGAVGNYSSAFGGKSLAKGKRSLAEGTTTVAQGDYSHAEGNNSVTLGANSHAEGKQTTTYGENAHAEGFDTFAEGYISHSEGYKTHAEGSVSHAEGQGTHAKGDQSHAEGNGSVAEGHYSHAEGYGTQAKGKASHASGEGTIAEGDYQTVIGTYNIPVDIIDLNENTKAKVLFIVGNGKNDEDRGVAFAILDNGEVISGYGDKPSSEASLINRMQFYDLLSQETTSYLIDGRLPYSVQPKTHIDVGNPDSIADYNYDFVFGKGLRTTNEYETVFGKYNSYSDADWQNPKALFVIGNGTSDSSRSNAFEVKEDGTAYAGGKKLLREGEASGGGGTKLYRHKILVRYDYGSETMLGILSFDTTISEKLTELYDPSEGLDPSVAYPILSPKAGTCGFNYTIELSNGTNIYCELIKHQLNTAWAQIIFVLGSANVERYFEVVNLENYTVEEL